MRTSSLAFIRNFDIAAALLYQFKQFTMIKISICLPALALTALPAITSLSAAEHTYHVQKNDIVKGYVTEHIPLSSAQIPAIHISGISYATVSALPDGARAGDPQHFSVGIATRLKNSMAVVRIPAYSAAADGSFRQVTDFTLTADDAPLAKTTSAWTDTNNSVLSTGTWFKVGVTNTGFYKLDFTLLSSMGIDMTSLSPGNVRVFGNGGNMLSENNAVARPADLKENPVFVSSSGSSFSSSDFVIFYATGPTAWIKDSINSGFNHQKNIYSDTAYYFICVDKGSSKKITQIPSGTANITASAYDYYDVHDTDEVNPEGVGKTWYGEQFIEAAGTNSQSFSFPIGATVSDVTCKISMATTCATANSTWSATLNGASIGSSYFKNATTVDLLITHSNVQWSNTCNCATANVGITFNPIDPTCIGYLNYIEISARRPLSIIGSQMLFRDWQTVGAGHVASFTLQNANSFTQVWDVTQPSQAFAITGSLSGGSYTFAADASMLHQYAALNSSDLQVPKLIGQVTNQNLHALPQTDLVIVSYPAYIDAANSLASYHNSHDNMRTTVVTTDQVYNEFSSGAQDVCAIRDFVRMFYKRAGTDTTQMPKYLLLYGGASYDYKYRTPNNSNFVPTYETTDDSDDISSYSADDIYGFLDDNENIQAPYNGTVFNVLDVGVGRMPSRSLLDANYLAKKIISYTNPATLGPWRIADMFVADNGDDAGAHQDDAEAMAASVLDAGRNLYNQSKVYLDDIPSVSTPAGTRAPNANNSIDEQIYKGVFMVNYNGHGNTEVWASERILTQDDYNNWNNTNMLPFMITATCDFGQFDHPEYISAAEQLLNRARGGAIAMLTTTKAVYASYNAEINTAYLAAQYTKNADGSWNTFGTACSIAKNSRYISSVDSEEIANFRKFALLGDPALTPDFPKYNIKIDSVTDGEGITSDTIKALGQYTLYGSVRDFDSSVLTTFNGPVYISVYDKPRSIPDNTYWGPRVFQLQDNIIYKGLGTVTNGNFSFTFIAPKDINYYMGTGKISIYADNGVTDAAGADTARKVGGFSDNPVSSSTGPLVKPYINDTLFINGGITGSNTSLYATLYDQTGINVSGYVIGHDLVAILDSNEDAPYILNDYYQTQPNTYRYGYVSFPLLGLANGHHTISVRAWDVNDNMGEGSISFNVLDSTVMGIQSLGNYPNPFTTLTHFVFEHNHPDEELNVQIHIYATDGKLVKTIKEDFIPNGSRSADLTWDGSDDNGGSLPSGVYVYQLNLSTQTGYQASAYQKLVIVR